MNYCCCRCDKSKRKVDNDADSDHSNPLLKEKSHLPGKSVGDIEIDSDGSTISDLSGGVPNVSPGFIKGHQGSMGSIIIPDEALTKQETFDMHKAGVVITDENIQVKPILDKQKAGVVM